MHDEYFKYDPYIIKHKPKSILCLPLINKNKIIGIIYLDNNVFTTGKIIPETINSDQVWIAIARLFIALIVTLVASLLLSQW